MLNVNQTVRSCQEILVVLVPIGNISKDKFNKYASYVRQQSVVELREHANYFERSAFLPTQAPRSARLTPSCRPIS
jgi:hypothetical protein